MYTILRCNMHCIIIYIVKPYCISHKPPSTSGFTYNEVFR